MFGKVSQRWILLRGSPGEEGHTGILGRGHGPGKGTGSEGIWPFMVDETESTIPQQELSPYHVSGSMGDQKFQTMPYPIYTSDLLSGPRDPGRISPGYNPITTRGKNPKAKL